MPILTPAKIILSGEHSVVYGAPAIGAPVALFLRSDWDWRGDTKNISLAAAGTEKILARDQQELLKKNQGAEERYAAFQAGTLPIGEVLPQPEDLVALALGKAAQKAGRNIEGLKLSIETDIPLSSGMGSSSALIVNILQGVTGFFSTEILDFAREIESFQHGASSGLDLALVAARSPLIFSRREGVIGTVMLDMTGVVLVNTGRPSVSTGQCVSAVREKFSADAVLWRDFSACTQNIRTALEENAFETLTENINQNQKLLEYIGVVPDKVRTFISECTQAGIAAKVCGAGAVAGDCAGMVWVLAGNDNQEKLTEITAKYGYGHGYHDFFR